MQEWLKAQMANGFSGFSGTSISASVRMSESLLNELVAEGLKDAMAPRTPRPVDPTQPDIAQLLKLITRTELKVVDGAVKVDLEIRV